MTLFISLAVLIPGMGWALSPFWWDIWRAWRDRNKPKPPVDKRDTIKELEEWHHDWRMRNDADYCEVFTTRGTQREIRQGLWAEPDDNEPVWTYRDGRYFRSLRAENARLRRKAARYKRSDLI